VFGSLRNGRRRRLLRSHAIPADTWRLVRRGLPLLQRLNADDERRLRELTLLFLHEKTIEAAGGLALDDVMRVTVAAQACLPILHLGLDWYDGWHAVILYPAEFVPRLEWQDEAGVVHVEEEVRSGEAWLHGPVILSWEDARMAGADDGYNVVIHEMAHKLDALNGATDGLPPLHRGMSVATWSTVFGAAFADHEARVARGEETFIDPYAAEAPEEFFAVVTELFFELPLDLHGIYPGVYELLRAFYRQHPLDSAGFVD
jgi:Mlc titration factor MtfA (ptsG expression regulator)